MPRNTFTQAERLKSEKRIGELFEKGGSVDAPLFRILYLPVDESAPFPAQVAFTASKRNFPRAVDRNRIKRLMRESYRLQKNALYSFLDEKKTRIALMILFTGKRTPDFQQVETHLTAALQSLKERLSVAKNDCRAK